MVTKKYRLKGHESFTPREGWISKGLAAVYKNPQLFTVAAGADALGVGTNMAKSIRYWLKTAGLMKESLNSGAVLTELGEIIYKNDPYLEDVFSLWIIHINIACNMLQATSWNIFFNKLNVSVFSRNELINMMTDLLQEVTGEIDLSERSIRDDCSAIISMYSNEKGDEKDPEDKKESPFKILGLLSSDGKNYLKCRPDMSKINSLVVMYMLEREFSKENPEKSMRSLLIDEVLEAANMPGTILNMNRIMVNDCLDELDNKGYIVVNRTAGLDIIYEKKSMSAEEIVAEYYERRDA